MAVQIILKNSSVEDKRPSSAQLASGGEISLNYNAAGAFLCCKDTDGNIQQVGGVKIDETAPDAPVKQTQWFQPSSLTLFIYDGSNWLPIAGGGGGGGGGGDIVQIIGNNGIDADEVAGIVTLDVELAGGDDGLEFRSSKLSASVASASQLGSVKVGDNIDVATGTISVPKATTSTFGVVKLGDGINVDGDGSISIEIPATTTYRGSCDLNNPPTGQINPDPAEKGDAYINSADAPAVDAGWTGISGTAEIGDLAIFDGTTWDLIPLGSGEAPVTSVNGKTGDVVLDYTDVGAASEAQGELADTALQPGDDISELNNDAGYITAAEAPVQSVNGKTGVVVLDAADVGALAPGDNVSLLANDAEYISKGDPVSDLDNDAGYITAADVDGTDLAVDTRTATSFDVTSSTGDDATLPAATSALAGLFTGADKTKLDSVGVTLSCMPADLPDVADRIENQLWYNEDDGRTYIWFTDTGGTSQFVDASPDTHVNDWARDAGTGTLTPAVSTDNVTLSGDLTVGNNFYSAEGYITTQRPEGHVNLCVENAALLVSPDGLYENRLAAIFHNGKAHFAGFTSDGQQKISFTSPGSGNRGQLFMRADPGVGDGNEMLVFMSGGVVTYKINLGGSNTYNLEYDNPAHWTSAMVDGEETQVYSGPTLETLPLLLQLQEKIHLFEELKTRVEELETQIATLGGY